MKLILGSLLLITMLTATTDRTVADLNGEWTGSVQGQNISFTFLKDGYLGMATGDDVLDPYNYVSDDLTMISVYKTDFTKKPIHIDWMFVKKGTNDIMIHREGIINFKDDNTIEIVMKEKGSRPVDFTGSGVLTLSRRR